MLSNINDLHEQYIHKKVIPALGIEDFHADYFDKVYYSHLIGYRKPNLDCYEYVMIDLGIKGEDILFIDDLKENIEGAKDAGWNASWHNPKEDILNNIAEYITENNF